MPTVAEIQAVVDVEVLALRETLLDAQQTQYRSTRPRYFQGIRTTDDSDLPNNTDIEPLKTATTNLRRMPTDQTEDWADFGLTSASLSYALELHTYGGPRGMGWVILARFKHGRKLYSLVINVGPETYRNQRWRQIEETI